MSRCRIYNGKTKTKPFTGYPGPIVDYEVDHGRATRWVSEQLPAPIIEAVDFLSGAWMAPLPEGTPPEAANDFRSGVLPEPRREHWRAFDADHFGPQMTERIATDLQCTAADLVLVPKSSLVIFPAQWIAEHLAAQPMGLALVHETSSRPVEGIPAWRGKAGHFYALTGPTWDEGRIADLVDNAGASWGEFAVLTNATPDEAQSRHVPANELLTFIARASVIVVGAYDGEGYLRWTTL